ncbi:kunitz-type protease inhibitor 2 [Mugil cephalus]|uniref:kunitz-type protease inhibitor 2 n=1 Tax=Mugil cephalus TaxID=48193 RepID=UPI001FB59482|nr:kunitz-type protease inhibitor 2 [Mugil cephalus]
MFGFQLLVLSLLIGSGSVLGCQWDQSVEEDQGLDLATLDSGALRFSEVSDPESCREACCKDPGCDLALVGLPADGGPQCLLVSCKSQDRDVCDLQPSSQFKVYRKMESKQARDQEPEDGGRVRVSPLLGSWEPRTNETNNIRCRLPMKVGSCRAAFPKFFYNVTSQSCSVFIYGGCESNGNNFDSQQECEDTCSGVTEMSEEEYAERCGAEPEAGPCRAALKHWFYNSETGSCQSFLYGGCRGNKNNYITEEHCKNTCAGVSVLPSSKKPSDDDSVSAQYKADCLVAPDSGPCRAAFTMYYYDPNSATCQSFIYGGCRGNRNQYGSKDECMNHCSSGQFEGRDKTKNRWTAAFFLFLTLASISALLLLTLVIVTLRRHRLNHRHRPTGDKQELLPEPDEQSSLDSVSLPDSPPPKA